MTFVQAALVVAAFLCSLVAGLLFAFAVVVMPGLRHLADGEFIRAFQVIDRVIQRNQPLFLLVWVGSVLAILTAAVASVWALDGVERLLTIVAAAVYLLGVHAPTFAVNIPLNNRLQALDVASMSEVDRRRARSEFEGRWNQWNVFRATFASVTSILLIFSLA